VRHVVGPSTDRNATPEVRTSKLKIATMLHFNTFRVIVPEPVTKVTGWRMVLHSDTPNLHVSGNLASHLPSWNIVDLHIYTHNLRMTETSNTEPSDRDA
jgi:hypothetical protein